MISVDLGDQLEAFVSKLVETGRYSSRNEVLREGVRLIRDWKARLAALDASIARGVMDTQTDRTQHAKDVFERLSIKYRKAAE